MGKSSVILLVMCLDELLMQSIIHENGEILDVFGSFLQEGAEPGVCAQSKLREVMEDDYRVEPNGKILDHIEKPEASVVLLVYVFKVTLSQKQKSNLTLKKGQLWVSRADIASDARVRYGDKLLFERGFIDGPMNIELSEDQYGKWIDAKLTSWEEKPYD